MSGSLDLLKLWSVSYVLKKCARYKNVESQKKVVVTKLERTKFQGHYIFENNWIFNFSIKTNLRNQVHYTKFIFVIFDVPCHLWFLSTSTYFQFAKKTLNVHTNDLNRLNLFVIIFIADSIIVYCRLITANKRDPLN